MKIVKFPLIALLLSITGFLVVGLLAGPTIIQDDRITSLSNTPVLGRGYSIATNTFQSTCLQKVKMTEPSYDFTYSFKSLETVDKMSLETQVDTKGFSNEFLGDLMDKISASGKMSQISDVQFYNHHVLADIKLHSYYASVDESATKMSTSAAALLQRNDLPGFFSSCGPYYVRSIGRQAKFLSIFTYMTAGVKQDLAFEKKLETQIKGFANGATTEKDTAETQSSFSVSWRFKQECSRKRLMITVAAFGLGKNERATLISYDIETFKAAIKDAFKTMQNPLTGKVSSIEVVPWVENTDFQMLVKLDEEVDKESGEKLLLYEKKQILNLNAEFLAEIERVDRSLLNLYYKAKICRDYIDTNWKRAFGFGTSLRNEFFKKLVLNNKGGIPIELSKLDGLLTSTKIDEIIEREGRFMYGEKRPSYMLDDEKSKPSGAAVCMKKMMKKGLFRVPYRDIEECKDIVKDILTSEDELIDSYCIPRLAKIEEGDK